MSEQETRDAVWAMAGTVVEMLTQSIGQPGVDPMRVMRDAVAVGTITARIQDGIGKLVAIIDGAAD